MFSQSSFKRSRTLAVFCLISAAIGQQAAIAGSNPNVGVSVNVNQPGFYGRIDIGNQPQPALIYQQPVIIQQTPVAMHQRPIYMRVPPGHYQQWARHCGYYRACGQPVYFVRDEGPRAYRDERRDGHRDGDWGHHHHDRHDHHHGHGHGHWKHHRD